MTGLRFPNSEFLALFKGKLAMIESPVIQRWKAESLHEAILAVLKERFGSVSRELTKLLRSTSDEKKLIRLNVLASQCADLAAFREALLA